MGEGPLLTYAFSDVGDYSVVAKITNASKAISTATVTHALTVRAFYQDDNRRVGYDSWRGVAAAAASGAGYRVAPASRANASLSFSGTEARYVAATGPDMGIAAVTVDGTSVGSVDLYTATRGTRVLSVTGLATASHKIGIKATGTRNPASSGTAISLDEFVVGTTHYDDRNSGVAYDSWAGAQNSNASAGSYRRSATASATTTLTFGGSSVRWLTVTGPDQGRALISIDGNNVATVDNYAAVRTWKVSRIYGGLTAGAHTIGITVLGTRNPSSTGNGIISDAFIVQ
jgi:hypothetical protein